MPIFPSLHLVPFFSVPFFPVPFFPVPFFPALDMTLDMTLAVAEALNPNKPINQTSENISRVVTFVLFADWA